MKFTKLTRGIKACEESFLFLSLDISFMASIIRIYFAEIPFPSPYFAKITR
jgi:hypothetical protein